MCTLKYKPIAQSYFKVATLLLFSLYFCVAHILFDVIALAYSLKIGNYFSGTLKTYNTSKGNCGLVRGACTHVCVYWKTLMEIDIQIVLFNFGLL